jgi:hypothetical protein
MAAADSLAALQEQLRARGLLADSVSLDGPIRLALRQGCGSAYFSS